MAVKGGINGYKKKNKWLDRRVRQWKKLTFKTDWFYGWGGRRW